MQCFNDYQHILLFLFGVIVLLFTSVLMIFIGLLTVGALGILTDVCKYIYIRVSQLICIKCNRNMRHTDTYENRPVMGIRTSTNGGHLWILQDDLY